MSEHDILVLRMMGGHNGIGRRLSYSCLRGRSDVAKLGLVEFVGA